MSLNRGHGYNLTFFHGAWIKKIYKLKLFCALKCNYVAILLDSLKLLQNNTFTGLISVEYNQKSYPTKLASYPIILLNI